MKKINSKFEAIMTSMPKISVSAEGELRGGFVSLTTRVSTENQNFNCADAGSTCSGVDNSATYYVNINCPQQEGAACAGKAQGKSVNCGDYTKYCGNTLPPTDTSEPSSFNIGAFCMHMSNSYLF